MFSNIGEKIKVLAVVCTIIGCVLSVVIAIVCWCSEIVWAGFVALILGCLVSWIGSFLLYGFGELIVQTNIVARGVQNLQAKLAYRNPRASKNAQQQIAYRNSQASRNAQQQIVYRNSEASKKVQQQNVANRERNPFFEIENGILKKYCGKETDVTIPDDVTSIGRCAFVGCFGLTSITIPESVTSIGLGAFSGCSGLTTITIPEGVTAIEESVFFRCKGLKSITIPQSVASIENHAFEECEGLETVFFAEPCGWERDGTPIDEKVLVKNIGESAIVRKIS